LGFIDALGVFRSLMIVPLVIKLSHENDC